MSALVKIFGVRQGPLSIDDWVLKRKGRAEFKEWNGTIRCDAHCHHEGNFVMATEYGETSGEAFTKVIAKIEKTIGEWR